MRITRHTDGSTDGIEMLRLMAPPDGHTRPTGEELEESDTSHTEDGHTLTGRKGILDSECPRGAGGIEGAVGWGEPRRQGGSGTPPQLV